MRQRKQIVNLRDIGNRLTHRMRSVRTRLKEIEKDLFFSEQIISSSRSMISVIDRSYRYVKVNKTFCQNQNSSSEKIVGHNVEDIWGRENFLKHIKNNIDNCFGGRVIYYQAVFETPAWGMRYHEVILRPVKDRKEYISHVLAETFDITEIKLKEKAALEIEWEFRHLESNLPIGFFRCDFKGKLLHVNNAFLRIMHIENETDATGRLFEEYYTDKVLFKDHLDTLFREGTGSFANTTLVTHDGNFINCRINAFLVHDGSGNIVYVDGAIEDFTREKELEKKLEQSRRLDTIGMLAGGIAHDFNTILTTIYGHSEHCLDSIDPSSEQYQSVKNIIKAVGRARSLTNQILTFSRQADQQRISVRVSEILEETAAFLEPSVPENIDFRLDLLSEELFVSADPTQLFRVFINLATNAFQAMENAGGSLTVSLKKCSYDDVSASYAIKDKSKDYALISFADTGPGMDENTAGRVFEPFFTERKIGKGTGLGLSVVYGIITDIDGDITVSSRKDAGTEIGVLIPVSDPAGASEQQQNKNAGIVVVPDNNNEVRIILMALRGSGFMIESVNPVKDWENKAAAADLVIAVDSTEGTSAFDIVCSLSGKSIKTPVLLISDFDVWLGNEKELPSDIVKENLFKPVSLRELICSIDNIINKPQ